jgi:helicase MOV-10
VSGMKNWHQHASTARHASKAAKQGLSPDVQPEEVDSLAGHEFCVICARHIPSRSWARHPMQHKAREQFLKFTSAIEETEKDKNGLTITGDFDFNIVESEKATIGVVRTGTIQSQVPDARISLVDIKLSSSKGEKVFPPCVSMSWCHTLVFFKDDYSFTPTINGSNRTITPRLTVTFSVKMIHEYIGRAEDRLELFFEDVHLQSRFIITRPLKVIVGSQSDHKMFKPVAPYVPRKCTKRHPQTSVVEGEAPPSTQAILYIVKLPPALIPKHLAASLSSGTSKEILACLQRVYLLSVLNSETYSKHFKHLVWAEEFQME